MNILIPMGGLGQRFTRENYRFPKPLIKIVGRPMLFWLIDYLDLKEDDIIYLGITEALEKQFALTQTLRVEYPKQTFKSVVLDFDTRGAAETLFIMLQSIDDDRVERKTISLDCDTIYFKPILERFRQLPAHLNASFYFEDHGGKPIFSYLKFEHEPSDPEHPPVVTDVAEKIMISTHANTGAYAFSSTSIMKEYCIQLLDEAVGESGEYYTTHIIKLMLTDKEPFVGLPVQTDDFVCVGTPDQLKTFLKRLKSKDTPVQVRKMRFCFDLDNTLVSYPTKYGDYSTVLPKSQNIRLVQELHAAGHYIIIQTARRMKTHKGNVGAVIADIGRVTIETLANFNIPYDELFFGKPYADIYIDDAAVHALIDTAKEIGWMPDDDQTNDVNPSTKSHTIQYLDNLIIKSSFMDDLKGEIFFYENAPTSIKDLFPQLHRVEHNAETNIGSIILEKIEGISFSQLFTNLCITHGRILKFLTSLKRIHLSLPADSEKAKGNVYENYSKVLSTRHEQYLDLYKSIDDHFQGQSATTMVRSQELIDNVVKYLNEYAAAKRGQYRSIIHGNPIFSSAVFTPENRIVFLDMRSCLGAKLSLEGDLNYDLGKVYQSLIGYDFILADKGHLISGEIIETYLLELIPIFEEFVDREYSNAVNWTDLKMITVHFLLNSIPSLKNFQHQTQLYQLAVDLYQKIMPTKSNDNTGVLI
ncbi:unnamed protein product [Adineta ricciae]|uniref:Uncharacterized protein n=2 Tax=Adineta ricciae TaxID=249248 RepID=A0A815X3D1_ADIRI|nr:unnamed protein product [Adineta ricciae]